MQGVITMFLISFTW